MVLKKPHIKRMGGCWSVTTIAGYVVYTYSKDSAYYLAEHFFREDNERNHNAIRNHLTLA